MKIARIYLRVSTIEQSNQRQEKIIDEATNNGYYIAKVYREKASGAIKDRPKLRELISDLQPGEIIIAENIDRISRLPLQDAMDLVNEIREKGAFLSVILPYLMAGFSRIKTHQRWLAAIGLMGSFMVVKP